MSTDQPTTGLSIHDLLQLLSIRQNKLQDFWANKKQTYF